MRCEIITASDLSPRHPGCPHPPRQIKLRIIDLADLGDLLAARAQNDELNRIADQEEIIPNQQAAAATNQAIG